MCQEVPGLFCNPFRVRSGRRRGDEDLTRIEVDEHHRVEVNNATFRDGSLGKEVAGPQCLCMNLQKLIPCSLAALWTGISALLFQDVLDGLSADAANPQLPELTRNPRVTKVCFPEGQKTEPTAKLFDNQVLEIEIVRDFGRASARDSDH